MCTPSTGFQFKRFFIAHNKCAMKVGTDGILLGSLASVNNVRSILDIGTGTGLVALMLAQRTEMTCQITALELEPNAYQQAKQNINLSPWAKRITVVQTDMFDFEPKQKFDLIVANPPYFSQGLPSKNAERDLARIAHQSHFSWLKQTVQWLSPTGKITFILPTFDADKLLDQAQQLPLFCHQYWQIKTTQDKPAKRSVITFCHQSMACEHKQLVIYQTNNQYTLAYRELTQAFYLNH